MVTWRLQSPPIAALVTTLVTSKVGLSLVRVSHAIQDIPFTARSAGAQVRYPPCLLNRVSPNQEATSLQRLRDTTSSPRQSSRTSSTSACLIRQSVDLQVSNGQTLVGETPSLSILLHTHLLRMTESGRAPFGWLTQRALQRELHTSIPQLKRVIHDYVDAHNEEGKPFVWTKSVDEVLDSVQRFANRTLLVRCDE